MAKDCYSSWLSPAICVLWQGVLYIWWRIFQVLHMRAGQNIISHIFEIFCSYMYVSKSVWRNHKGLVRSKYLCLLNIHKHRRPRNLCWYSSCFLAPPAKEKQLWRTEYKSKEVLFTGLVTFFLKTHNRRIPMSLSNILKLLYVSRMIVMRHLACTQRYWLCFQWRRLFHFFFLLQKSQYILWY